jgi:ABC-type Fe3+-siderophore transport system, permease component
MGTANNKTTSTAGGFTPLGTVLLVLLPIVTAILALGIGRIWISPAEVIRCLGKLMGSGAEIETLTYKTIVNIRIPRILLGLLCGAGLSTAGCALQGFFANPLATPDTIGVASGASFGAAFGILIGLNFFGIQAVAFGFGVLAVTLTWLATAGKSNRGPGAMILAGIMIGSLFSAGTSYLKLVADPSNQLPAITYWLLGSLSGTRLSAIPVAAIPMCVGLVPLLLLRWRLNLLSLGDSEAKALGVNTDLLRAVLILCATLVTAAAIAVSGVIGWVGLVIPHLSRKLVGSDHRGLLPCSMLTGASFLLLVDDVSRNLLATEIPIGILTAVIGAPFFIWLLLRKEKTL